MVTLTEVARLSNVSASTVSNILNGKKNVGEATRQRVLKVIEETGYEPNFYASRMRSQTSRTIGIIAEDLSIYTMPIVERTMAECEEAGYRTMLVNLRMYDRYTDTWYYDETKLYDVFKVGLSQLRSLKVDGVIYIGGHSRYLNIFTELEDLPLVVAYALAKDDRIPSVIIDDEKGGYDVTKYLLSLGHKNVVLLAGVHENLHTQKRLAGYQKALYEYKILYDPSKVFYGNWVRQSGYDGARTLMQFDPDAIFCMNDFMAAGAIDYLREKGISVPEDISIIGFDDVELSAYTSPALTTNRINHDSIGRLAAQKMIAILNGEDEARKEGRKPIKVPCDMVIRDSVVKR